MATVYGKHSKYANTILDDQNDKMAIVFITFLCLASGLIGYFGAYSLGLALLALVPVYFGFLFIIERLDKMMGVDSRFKSYVCFPNCDIDGHIFIDNVTVVGIDKLLAYIKGLPNKFSRSDIARYKRALIELARETAARPVKINSYGRGNLRAVAGVARR